jgi:hypothetical protein
MAAFPSLSELLAWPTEHLAEASDYWEMIGTRCFAAANQVWRAANVTAAVAGIRDALCSLTARAVPGWVATSPR